MSSPDTQETLSLNQAGRGVQKALVIVLLVVALSAFMLGAIPLVDVAKDWGQLPVSVALLLPVVLDAAAVAAALAAIVRHTRGQRATLEMVLLLLTVIVSVAAQIVHAYWVGGQQWVPTTIITAAVLGSAPIIVLLASHAAIRTLTPPKSRRGRRASSTPRPTTAASAGATKPPTKKKAAPPRPRPAPPADAPERNPGEDDLDFGVRLVDAGISLRGAAEASGASRGRITRALENRGQTLAA